MEFMELKMKEFGRNLLRKTFWSAEDEAGFVLNGGWVPQALSNVAHR